MVKKEVTQKVIEKLAEKEETNAQENQKLAEEDLVKKELLKLVKNIKTNLPEKITPLLLTFKEVTDLTDEQYAKILDNLISTYKIHSLNPEYKKELKKITDNPPVKIYFDLLY